MIKSFAVFSLFASAVLASSSSTATPSASATVNLIPSGISQSCSDFLTSLNHDTSSNCIPSLVSITSSFAPGANATTLPSASQVQSTLNNLCSPSTTSNCQESTMRTWLMQFYAQCSTELTSNPVTGVKQMYDVLYALTPLRTALCSKADNGAYCVTQLPTPNALKNATSASSPPLTPNDIINSLVDKTTTLARRAAGVPVLSPNLTTYAAANVPFLFLQPASGAQAALSSSSQCTACTRNIMTAFINFESNTPYGPGLKGSMILSGQQALYDSVVKNCGSSFLSGAVQAAGGLSGGSLPSGAMHNVVTVTWGFLSIWIGILAVMISPIF